MIPRPLVIEVKTDVKRLYYCIPSTLHAKPWNTSIPESFAWPCVCLKGGRCQCWLPERSDKHRMRCPVDLISPLVFVFPLSFHPPPFCHCPQ